MVAQWLFLTILGVVVTVVSSNALPSHAMVATERQCNLQNPQKANRLDFLRVRLRGGKGAKVTDDRKDVDESSKSVPSGLGLPAPEEDPEIAAEQEDESCRWGYLKRAEREMRIAEEKAALREKEHNEYLEKRRKGEIEDPDEEVKDTLRWGDDSAKSKKIKPKKGKAKAELEPPPPPVATMRRNEEEIVMAGRGGDQDVDEESVFDSEEDESELPEDELKRIEEEERQFEIRRVEAWLTELKMGKYLQLFLQEGWDTLDDILNMTQEDLLALGLKRGHVRRLLSAMGRDMSASLARASIARDVSYPRDHSTHPHRGYGHARASRARGDADIDIKPWSRESMPRQSQARYEDEHQYEMQHRRGGPERSSGMHTSVRTSQGPGGSSRLAEAGGLGAFLMGVSPEEEEMENRHRQLQKQKEQIQERLERERRQEYHYGGGRRYH